VCRANLNQTAAAHATATNAADSTTRAGARGASYSAAAATTAPPAAASSSASSDTGGTASSRARASRSGRRRRTAAHASRGPWVRAVRRCPWTHRVRCRAAARPGRGGAPLTRAARQSCGGRPRNASSAEVTRLRQLAVPLAVEVEYARLAGEIERRR
jgi:hypothetical protein